MGITKAQSIHPYYMCSLVGIQPVENEYKLLTHSKATPRPRLLALHPPLLQFLAGTGVISVRVCSSYAASHNAVYALQAGGETRFKELNQGQSRTVFSDVSTRYATPLVH